MTRCNGRFAFVLALLTAFTLRPVAPTAWSRDTETSESFSDREKLRQRPNMVELNDARLKFKIDVKAMAQILENHVKQHFGNDERSRVTHIKPRKNYV